MERQPKREYEGPLDLIMTELPELRKPIHKRPTKKKIAYQRLSTSGRCTNTNITCNSTSITYKITKLEENGTIENLRNCSCLNLKKFSNSFIFQVFYNSWVDVPESACFSHRHTGLHWQFFCLHVSRVKPEKQKNDWNWQKKSNREWYWYLVVFL